jgi:hypothetical protein
MNHKLRSVARREQDNVAVDETWRPMGGAAQRVVNRLADALRRNQFSSPPLVPDDTPVASRFGKPLPMRSLVRWCFHRSHLLSPRDRQFIEDLTEWHTPLSTNQEQWLQDIVAKLKRVGAL